MKGGRGQIGEDVRKFIVINSAESGDELELASVGVSPPWRLIDRSERRLSPDRIMLAMTLNYPSGSGLPGGYLELTLSRPEPARFRIPLHVRGWRSPPALPALEGDGE